MYLQLCHPTTNKYINVFSPEVMTLINDGYSIEDVLNLSKQTPPKYNRYNVFTNDLLLNYMMHLELKDIKSLCLIDKDALLLYKDKYLWQLKITQYLSQVDWLHDKTYIGTYTAKDYYCVINAISESNRLYNKRPTLLFDNNENLQISNQVGNLEDYKPSLYECQFITVKKDHINIKCRYRNSEDWDHYTLIIDNRTDRKIFIFDIFYYFPSVLVQLP
jgi:hypothetical protein